MKKLLTPDTIAKRLFTVEDANARLPLLRSILRDVTILAGELKALHEQLILTQMSGSEDAQQEQQLRALAAQVDERQATMAAYEREIAELGAELKDAFIGLVDFPATREGREVCLCWKLGEPRVAHWHETDAGYGGRRPLQHPSPN